jgi:hypothetical protein
VPQSLFLRLPGDRTATQHDKDAESALPILHVFGHVRILVANEVLISFLSESAPVANCACDVAQQVFDGGEVVGLCALP